MTEISVIVTYLISNLLFLLIYLTVVADYENYIYTYWLILIMCSYFCFAILTMLCSGLVKRLQNYQRKNLYNVVNLLGQSNLIHN